LIKDYVHIIKASLDRRRKAALEREETQNTK
jgi:hypothetical protein